VITIFIGPSGIGKSFAIASLVRMFPGQFACVKVYTNRQPRSSESQVIDRAFVSSEEFERMVQANEFVMHEYFGGNRYGYRAIDFESNNKHLILNAPPFFLPKLLQNKEMIVVGLQAPPNYKALLDTRMQARGDSPKARAARQPFIERDIQDINNILPLINKHGGVFLVEDDSTIPDEVIPWLIARLGVTK
jgi:guanylate kinase